MRVAHPGEYAKIPQDKLNDPAYGQQHLGCLLESADGSTTEDSPEMWVIGFFPLDEESEQEDIFVELNLERPAAEDSSYGKCSFHTLAVSREFCPIHGHRSD